MRVYTHYPALAPAIQDAGYEPALLEPLDLPPGAVVMAQEDDVLVVGFPNSLRTLVFERSPDEPGVWSRTR